MQVSTGTAFPLWNGKKNSFYMFLHVPCGTTSVFLSFSFPSQAAEVGKDYFDEAHQKGSASFQVGWHWMASVG